MLATGVALACLTLSLLLSAAGEALAQGATATGEERPSVDDAATRTDPPEPGAAAPAATPPPRSVWWHLGQTTPAGAGDPSAGWWKRLSSGTRNIRDDGGLQIFVSGYAWHPPTSYSEKEGKLNEKAWGTGVGRALEDGGSRQRSLYLFVSEDSHNDPQVMAGYSWLARTPSKGGLRVGAGYSVLAIMRDEFGYIPMPFGTPLLSLDVGPVQGLVSYVPHYDVWFVFGRITVKGQRTRVSAGR